MATVLSALGITNTTAPDPSSYDYVKAESSNLASAKAGLNALISNISIAVSSAQLLNISGSFMDTLTSLSREANAALSSTMTSAQLAAKTLDITARLETAKTQQEQAQQKQLVSDVQGARDKISARVSAISSDTSAPLLKQYNNLLDDATKSFTAAQAGTMTPTSTDYQTADQLNDKLDALDTQKDAEDGATFNWTRYMKRMLRYVMYALAIIAVAGGLTLGGIITSNMFADDYFWGIKLFYFIYGAVLFPIPIIHATFVSTPYWVSTLMPLKSLNPRTVPTVNPSTAKSAPEVTAAKHSTLPSISGLPGLSGIPGLSGLPGLSGIPSIPHLSVPSIPHLSVPSIPHLSVPSIPHLSVPSIQSLPSFSLFGGAMDLSGGIGGATTLSMMDSLFGYVLVDSKNPTVSQTTYRSELHTLCIVESILIGVVSLYYGLDKTLLRNQL